jgi:hypothetical protein
VVGFSEAFSQLLTRPFMAGYPDDKAAVGFADNVHQDVERRSCAVDLDGRGRVVGVARGASAQSSAPDGQGLLSNLQLACGVGHKH